MSINRWFSTKLRFAIFIGSLDCDFVHKSIYLMRASDFDEAYAKAISIGRRSEKKYLNADGQEVACNFAEIISLDIIEADNLEEIEVHSEPVHLDGGSKIPFGKILSPEASSPTQTI